METSIETGLVSQATPFTHAKGVACETHAVGGKIR